MEEELRQKLFRLLKLRCVFPNDLHAEGSVARCMLEMDTGKGTVPRNAVEDIIVKIVKAHQKTVDSRAVVKYVISRLFSRVNIYRDFSKRDTNFLSSKLSLEQPSPSNALHPGIAAVLKIFEQEDETAVVQIFSKHSMLSVSRFHSKTTFSSPTLGRSAGVGSRDLRLRFVLYQLLQAICFVHSQGLCLENLKPPNIMLDDDMWLTLPVGISDRTYSSVNELLTRPTRGDSGCNPSTTASKLNHQYVYRPVDYYEPMTVRWASGKVTNFEYLMAINFAAGRSMMDPLFHPILPWVTDFSKDVLNPHKFDINEASKEVRTMRGPTNGFRDLTKTKFRLSKGDDQLETTFMHSDPPHHVPESLSELTYYIYMARRTPMQVLRRVVRDVFVPEHYPHSVARMYDWTPDECIPEFYFDVTVFNSIHKDFGLPDLDMPPFANTPGDFIRYHRAVLECAHVSEKINRWIDLTFGYCLEGRAAEANMNVPLRQTLSTTEQLGDSPNLDKHPGFVMLFDRPHPQRRVHKPSFGGGGGVITEGLSSFQPLTLTPAMRHDDEFSFDNFGDISLRQYLGLDAASTSQESQQQQQQQRPTNYKLNIPVYYHYSASTAPPTPIAGAEGGQGPIQAIASALAATRDTAQGRQSTFSESKRSLVRPSADPSFSFLSTAGNIDLPASGEGKHVVHKFRADSDELKFGADFGSFMEPKYSLTSTRSWSEAPGSGFQGSRDVTATSSPALGERTTQSGSVNKYVPFWDYEFESALACLKRQLQPEIVVGEGDGEGRDVDNSDDERGPVGCGRRDGGLGFEAEVIDGEEEGEVGGRSVDISGSPLSSTEGDDIELDEGSRRRERDRERERGREKRKGSNAELTATATSASVPFSPRMEALQGEDIFAVGCIVAELFLGQPLFSACDLDKLRSSSAAKSSSGFPPDGGVNGHDFRMKSTGGANRRVWDEAGASGDGVESFDRAMLRFVYRRTASLPLVIRRIVAFLTQPMSAVRPRVGEILQACVGSAVASMDEDITSSFDGNVGAHEPGYIDFLNSHSADDLAYQRRRGGHVDMLDMFCGSLFPPHFRIIYTLVGRIKLCQKESQRIRVVIESLQEIMNVPLEGLSLALPHLLGVIGDPRPFMWSDSNIGSLQVEEDVGTTSSASASASAAADSSPALHTRGSTSASGSATGRRMSGTAVSRDPSNSSELNGKGDRERTKDKEKDMDREREEHRLREKLVGDYVKIIDVMACRLGVDGCEKLLVPRVVSFLNGLMSPLALQMLLQSSLWVVLIRRAGVKNFLRHFLPMLLTYLASGTMHKVSQGSVEYDKGEGPLWSTLASSERTEWLHNCSLPMIRNVQQVAIQTIISLTQPDALGCGLSARYLVPTLLCLVGVPQLAAASYGVSGPMRLTPEQAKRFFSQAHLATTRLAIGRWDHPPSLDDLCAVAEAEGDELDPVNNDDVTRDSSLLRDSDAKQATSEDSSELDMAGDDNEDIDIDHLVSKKAQYNPYDMFVVRAISGLCNQLGQLVASEIVLSKIFNGLLPELQNFLLPRPSSSIIAAIMEVLLLVHSIIPSLTPETIVKSILQTSRFSGLSLPVLLTMIPLTPPWVMDDVDVEKIDLDIDNFLDLHRCYFLQREVIRMVVTSSMLVGSQACIEFVLPWVDKYFLNFVEVYGNLPIAVTSKTMMRCFEVGAELYLPLVNLCGADAFTHNVTGLNSRLELWLVSVGSGAAGKCPPLPDSIQPPAVQHNNPEKDTKKGLFQRFGRMINSIKVSASGNGIGVGTSSPPVGTSSTSSTSSSAVVAKRPGIGKRRNTDTEANKSGHSKEDIWFEDFNEEISPVSDRLLSTTAPSRTIVSTPFRSPTEGMELKAYRMTGDTSAATVRRTSVHFEGSQDGGASSVSSPPGPYDSHFDSMVKSIGSVPSPQESSSSSSSSGGGGGGGGGDVSTAAPRRSLSSPDAVKQAAPSSGKDERSDRRDRESLASTSEDTSDDNDLLYDDDDEDDEEMPMIGIKKSLSRRRHSVGDRTSTAAAANLSSSEETGVEDLLQSSAEPSSPHAVHVSWDGTERNVSFEADSILANVQQFLTSSGNDFNFVYAAVNLPSDSHVNILKRTKADIMHTAPKIRKQGKSVTSLLSAVKGAGEEEEEDEDEVRYAEATWLLAGRGRWNVSKEARRKRDPYTHSSLRDNMEKALLRARAVRGDRDRDKGRSFGSRGSESSIGSYPGSPFSPLDTNPAAQMSITSPRITADVAAEAASLFQFGMTTKTQWCLDEPTNPIRCMCVDPTEALLLTSSKVGVKVMSLNSQPVKQTLAYRSHTTAPFAMSFMRSGVHVASCDGSIHVWDLEKQHMLAFLPISPDRGGFTALEVVSPRLGVTPSLGGYGDNQLVTTVGNMVNHYDFRAGSAKSACKSISEWTLPPVPVYSHFSSSSVDAVQLSSVAVQDNYIFAGSASGCLWGLDRRMGKVLNSWHAHEGPVVKLSVLSEKNLLSVSERSAFVWNCKNDSADSWMVNGARFPLGGGRNSIEPAMGMGGASLATFGGGSFGMDVSKVLTLKNMPDHPGFTANTVLVQTFEKSGGSNNLHQDMGLPVKTVTALYGMAGHKMYAGKFPTFDEPRAASRQRETATDGEEMKLAQTYFSDRSKTKITKSKLQVTSATILPLRRLLLLGTEDGFVRVVS